MKQINYVLLQSFLDCVDRIAHPHTMFFPFLRDCYIFPYEREILANCREIRKAIQQIVDRRRRECEADPSMKNKGDFLQILLEDETTRHNNELIVDECLTFFFAGTQTSNLTSQNLIYMLAKHPNYREKILKELDEIIVQPYLQAEVNAGRLAAGDTLNGVQILDLMNFENTGDL
jgi:cytochrome P450